MSDHWLQFVRRGFPPTAMLLILIGQALPTCGQETKPIPANEPQAKPSPVPSNSLSPKKDDEKEEGKDARVLVGEVLIKGADQALQDEVYGVIKTQPGRTTTRSQLQEDINAIFATGFFSNVKAVPEDTPLGVRVTFEVQVNPVLQAIKVEGNRVLPEKILTETFSDQYGQVLNLNRLQDGIKKVNEWYQKNGYVLAQVLDSPAVSPEGIVTLQVAEGEVEGIRVRFINKDGDDKDAKGNPIRGRTRDFIVTREFQTKPGDILNRAIVEQDLQRAFGLGFFEDVRLSLQPSETDPRKVVVVANVAEAEDEAEWLFNTANRLSQKNTNDSKQQAIANYQKLLQLHRTRKDKKNEAILLHRIAAVYADLGKYDQALDFYNQSLSLARAIPLPGLEVMTLSDIGNTYYEQENYSRSFDWYGEALQLAQSLENISIEEIDGSFVFSSGQSLRRGRFLNMYFSPASVKRTASSFAIRDTLKPSIQFKLGELYQRLGDYPQSLILFQSALPKWEMLAAKDKENALVYKLPEVFNLAYLASVYGDLGDEGQALIYRNEATQRFLKYSDTLKQQGGGDQLLAFFGTMLDTASSIDGVEEKKFDNSMQKFFKSFSTVETSALISVGIGDRYAERGEDAQAFKVYEQALAELKNLKNPTDKPIALQAQVKVLNGMGKVYGKSASQQTAIEFHQQALKVLQTSDSSAQIPVLQAETLNLLGKAYFRAKQFPQARNAYTQAIAVSTTAKDLAKIAESLLGMAEIERALKNFAKAQTHIEAALTQLEVAALTRLKPQPLQPATQPGSSVDTSTDPKGQPTFSISAKSQPNTRVTVSDATGNFNSYKDSTALLAANRNYYEVYIDLLMERYRQTGVKQYETQAFLVSERAKAQSLRVMLGQRDRSNDSSSRVLAAPASLQEIQATLDNDTILLEFFLGKQRSYLWAVTKNGISSYVLPSQAQIDLVSRQFYEYLTNPSLRVRPNSTAQTGMELSQLILGGAAAPKLAGKKRILVVSDGGLQYIPFSALPMRLAEVDSNTPNLASLVDPLLIRHEVVNLPSASTLIAIRQNRAKRTAPTKTLTVLADPIFGREDERIGVVPTKQLFMGAADVEQFYPRLPGTQLQAEQILALVPEAQRSQKFGFDASRQTALSPDLGQYKIIHFATHGILDSQRPERSGMILSMVNQQGELQRSLLSPPDIFNTLKLSADLVVLSGCRTGLGTGTNNEYLDRQNTYEVGIGFTIPISTNVKKNLTFNGEGVVGLTGSFLYAGADRVVASLWSVEEKATSDLMVRFYTNMLNGRDGKNLTPAAALREAQLSMWKARRWESPYDWAGFVLQGEWR